MVGGYLGGCPTVAGERRPDPPRQGRVGAARRSGDDGGGAKVRQRRPVGEEAASGGGGGQIRQSRDEWGRRGRQAVVVEGGNVDGGSDDRWGRRQRQGVGQWRRCGRATGEREQKLGGKETGIEAWRGGDKN